MQQPTVWCPPAIVRGPGGAGEEAEGEGDEDGAEKVVGRKRLAGGQGEAKLQAQSVQVSSCAALCSVFALCLATFVRVRSQGNLTTCCKWLAV